VVQLSGAGHCLQGNLPTPSPLEYLLSAQLPGLNLREQKKYNLWGLVKLYEEKGLKNETLLTGICIYFGYFDVVGRYCRSLLCRGDRFS
jgi:hypothetical protein